MHGRVVATLGWQHAAGQIELGKPSYQSGTDTNGVIRAIETPSDGVLVIGGNFTNVGNLAANDIARQIALGFAPMGTGLNGPVYAIKNGMFNSIFAGGPCITDSNDGDMDFDNNGMLSDDNDLRSCLLTYAGGPCPWNEPLADAHLLPNEIADKSSSRPLQALRRTLCRISLRLGCWVSGFEVFSCRVISQLVTATC